MTLFCVGDQKKRGKTHMTFSTNKRIPELEKTEKVYRAHGKHHIRVGI